jgi:hypothetical protein
MLNQKAAFFSQLEQEILRNPIDISLDLLIKKFGYNMKRISHRT